MKEPMSIVRIKTKGQVTLPTAIREKAGLNIGDLLEAKIERGNIVLKPQTLIDRQLAEGLEDIKAGRVYGPFKTVDELVASLRSNMKKRATKKSKRS
jgi:AbrB family looped-hinge helix DNA binding protein